MARRYGKARLVLMVGLLALGVGLAALAQGQTPKAKDAPKADPFRVIVPIVTVDGVELVGTYYPSTGPRQGKDAPCAILLHKFGSDRSKGDWDKLARELQEKVGMCVLAFDFRGHGDSRSVQPNFWKVAVNSDLVIHRGPDKTRIDAKDLNPGYLPPQGNDI